jgi:hypothetical protein
MLMISDPTNPTQVSSKPLDEMLHYLRLHLMYRNPRKQLGRWVCQPATGLEANLLHWLLSMIFHGGHLGREQQQGFHIL